MHPNCMRKCFYLLISLILQKTAFTQHNDGGYFCCHPMEIDARFPGDHRALQKFIAKNFVQPELVTDSAFTVRGTIGFTVDRNGRVGNFKIIDTAGFCCDEEIMRILSLRSWKPATLNLRPVNCYKRLPFVIVIETEPAKKTGKAIRTPGNLNTVKKVDKTNRIVNLPVRAAVPEKLIRCDEPFL